MIRTYVIENMPFLKLPRSLNLFITLFTMYILCFYINTECTMKFYEKFKSVFCVNLIFFSYSILNTHRTTVLQKKKNHLQF